MFMIKCRKKFLKGFTKDNIAVFAERKAVCSQYETIDEANAAAKKTGKVCRIVEV